MLKIFNDLASQLIYVVYLCLLDLSAAFNTVDNNMLLSLLETTRRPYRFYVKYYRVHYLAAVIHPVDSAAGGCRKGTWLQPVVICVRQPVVSPLSPQRLLSIWNEVHLR